MPTWLCIMTGKEITDDQYQLTTVNRDQVLGRLPAVTYELWLVIEGVRLDLIPILKR